MAARKKPSDEAPSTDPELGELTPFDPQGERRAETERARERGVSMADASEWPTIMEVSEQTGIPISTLRRWASEGKLLAVTVGRAYRVNPSEAVRLQASEDRRAQAVSPDPEATRAALEQSRETGSPDAPTTAMQVQPPAAMQMQPQAAMQAQQQSAPFLPPSVLGLMNALADLTASTNTRLSAADRHVEQLISALLSSMPKLQNAFVAQLDSALAHNKLLQEEIEKLREDLRAWHESQRTDTIKAKELEIKKVQVDGFVDLGKMLAPSIMAFIGAKLDPSDPTKADTAIAAILTKITEEQAKALAEKNLVTGEQAFAALGFRQTPPKPGELTRWMQSFSGEAIGKIVASDVLPKELALSFVAAHEAAGKVTFQAPAPTTTQAPPPKAPPPAGVPEGGRVLDAEQVNTLKEFIGVVFVCGDVVTTEKDSDGNPITVLELLGSKMSPRARSGLKHLGEI